MKHTSAEENALRVIIWQHTRTDRDAANLRNALAGRHVVSQAAWTKWRNVRGLAAKNACPNASGRGVEAIANLPHTFSYDALSDKLCELRAISVDG